MSREREGETLLERIKAEIHAEGPISFARFQELALYDPELGYYSKGARLGREGGDFWTAPEMSPAFGELIGVQIDEMAALLGRPAEFQVVEFGAGTGALAAALLDEWRRTDNESYRAGVYRIVETSPVLRRVQQERLAQHGDVVIWGDSASHETMPMTSSSPPGVLLMNEVLDALPVHRVVQGDSGLQEIRVAVREGALHEILVPAGEVLIEQLARALPEGQSHLALRQEAELRLAYEPFLEDACREIGDGYLLSIDYGMSAARLYAPERPRGTLMAYHRHLASEDLLARPGEQDITAHVDLSAVERIVSRLGFEKLGETVQARFLLALGLGDRIEALEKTVMNERTRIELRLGMTSLVRPGGMGEMFRVWTAGRGVAGKLRGLTDPLEFLARS